MPSTVPVSVTPATPAAERGSLHVADKVVHRIARQAAQEIEHTVPVPRRLVDRIPGRRSQATRVATVISEKSVAVQVTVAVQYPYPVVEVTRAVRAHVTETVARMCDLTVTSVDIDVIQLRRPRPTPGSGR